MKITSARSDVTLFLAAVLLAMAGAFVIAGRLDYALNTFLGWVLCMLAYTAPLLVPDAGRNDQGTGDSSEGTPAADPFDDAVANGLR